MLRTIVGRHCATICNHNIDLRLLPVLICLFNLAYNVHALHNMTKDNVLTVKVGSCYSRDEELTTIRPRTS